MGASPTTTPLRSDGWFRTTHWSVVRSAQAAEGARAAEALETLCRAYWYPLYAYARRCGRAPPDAEDLTQGFFARLLEKDYLKAAAREKGRFRTFLLVAFKRYLANEWDREHAQKRGGFTPVASIDQELAEARFGREPAVQVSPEVLYDRQWASVVLDRAIAQLREEYVASGRAELFTHLQSCLAGEESALPYAQIAARLQLTEGAVKMAIQRLRARYREVLQEAIAQTVSSPEEVEDELRCLFSAFSD